MPNIKMLHFADAHLDSPFSNCDLLQSEQRREELRSAFTSVMTYVRTGSVRYVLIPGDLFDYDFVTPETVSLVLAEFEKNRNTRFIIAPGNHDYYSPGSVWAKTAFPSNVYIFKSQELSSFDFPDDNITFYGYAFTGRSLTHCPFVGRRAENPRRINVLVGHADTTSAISDCCPVCERDIELFGADYTALGHIHNTDGIHTVNDGKVYAYPGCLEGRSFDECGYKGAILAEISPDEKTVSTRFFRFSKRRYISDTVDVTGASSFDGILEKLRERVAVKHYTDDTILRFVLTGSIPPSVSTGTSALAAKLDRLYSVQVVDRTLPLFDDEVLKNDMTIRGEFYRAMEEKLTSGSRESREIAALALRYGLSALSGDSLSGDPFATDGLSDL